MKKLLEIACTAGVLLIVFLSVVAYSTKNNNTAADYDSNNEGTKIRIIPETNELGPNNVINSTFKVAVVIENVSNLYGFDVQLNWTTEYIKFVSKKTMVPVEDYPVPIPPSPYAGILHADTMKVKDVVSETAPIPGSEVGTMGWWAYTSMAPAEPFNGNGTIVILTFKVVKQPYVCDAAIKIQFIKTSSTPMLSDKDGKPIPIEAIEDAVITLHGMPQPIGPSVEICSYEYTGSVPTTFDVNITISKLDPYWDLAGFDINVTFDPEVMQITNVELGDFAFNYNITFEIKREINNTAGYAWLAYVQIPPRSTPSGGGTLITLTFNATSSSVIKITSILAAFPHPERPEPPWLNLESSVPIPHEDISGKANINAQLSHTILINDQEFTINTLSNSTVSNVTFNSTTQALTFNVSGKEFIGYCNITIPKNFMQNGWQVLIDDTPVNFQLTEDEANTYIYFTYELTVHQVKITATWVVPEFTSMLLVLIVSAITLAYIVFKKMNTTI